MRLETEAALAAVGVAQEMMARRVGADRVTSKGGRDLVTDTDVAVEDAVRAILGQRFPGWAIVGEERGGEDRVGDRPYWLVDPICGTRNFASNVPLYAVNVALVEDGVVTLAAMGDGATGDRYYAERGGGAYLARAGADVGGEGRPLRVDGATDTLAIDPGSHELTPHVQRAAEFLRMAVSRNRWDIRMLSTSLSLAHVAAGRMSGYVLFLSSGPVHTAPGCLLVEEAGGIVTDHAGRAWDLSTPAFVAAATPELHADLIRMLADLAPSS